MFVVLLLLVFGCAGEQPGEDLLASLPHAEVLRADGELLFSERVTRRGWGLVERDGEGAFRWALGEEAEVEFHSMGEATTLSARVRGATGPEVAAQPVVALLNGIEVAALDLAAEWADLELLLVPPALRRGANRLALRFSSPSAPGEGSEERRPLAACFRQLRLGRERPIPENQRPLRIGLGSAAADGGLGVGWGEPQDGGPEDAGWRWAPYPRADLRLDLPPPADRRLLLTSRRPEELASQRVELWLNGHHLGGDDLDSSWSTVSVDAPREEWRPRENELLLRFETRRVVEGASRMAQVARLEVETLGEPALEQSFDERGPLVEQPSRTSVDLFRRLPAGEPRLVLEAGWRPGSSVRLALDVEPDGGEPVEAWRGELVDGEPSSVDLSAWAGALVRLRLSAVGADIGWRRLELEGGVTESSEPVTVAWMPAAEEVGTRPNILLYVIDALRADRTSLYGYHRPTTPRLEALAETGIVFDPAWANASWTRPATASLLTGALPSRHGVRNTIDELDPRVTLLSETLQAAGYATHALVTNPYLSGLWSMERGWHEYRYIDTAPGFSDSSGALNREVIPRLPELASAEEPFFLYLHSMDVHAPYQPPDGYRPFVDAQYRGTVDGSVASVEVLQQALRRDGVETHGADLEQLGALYDGGILHNDARLGELLDAMEESGLMETTAILITSDHGEELFDHGGAMHGHSLYQEQIAIPMLLRPPGGVAPRRIAGVQQVDVAIMLAAFAGVGPGESAAEALMLLQSPGSHRPAFAEEEMLDRRLWSYVEEGMKLHYNRNAVHAAWQGRETHELFDLSADPGETINLYPTRPVLAGYLLERARRIGARLPSGASRSTIDTRIGGDELRERLAALGYLP